MYSTVVMAGLGLVVAFVVYRLLLRCTAGAGRAPEISDEIHDHAMSFLGRTYVLLAMTAAVVALLVFAGFQAWRMPLAVVVGVLCSACAGYLGLYVTWRADSRVAEAARADDAGAAHSVMLHGGSVVALVVAGTGLLGLGSIYLLQGAGPAGTGAILGFGLGVSATALWSRVGGGMTAESIGSGLTLARKNGAGTGRDEAHDPVLIAYTARSNVVDTAGMGSDLLGSWCGSIIAAMIIASTLPAPVTALIGPQHQLMLLPLVLASSGFVCAMVGMAIVWLASDRLRGSVPRVGTVGAAVLFIGVAYFVVEALDGAWLVWLCVLGGALGGQVIALFLEYATTGGPARHSAGAGKTGTVTAAGLIMSVASVVIPVLFMVAVLLLALALMPEGAGAYGMAITAVGMLSTVGITMSMHACGPVAGNAARIAAMAGLGAKARGATERLDEEANASAAAGKTFAIVAGGLAALVMIAAFIRLVSHRLPDLSFHVGEPAVLIGLFLGGVLPFLLAAIILRALSQSSLEFSREIRRRFQETPDRVQGAAEPDSVRGMDTGAASMIRRIALPGLLVLLAPIVVGFGLGARALGGFLVGALSGGLLLALVMPVAAVAWPGVRQNVGQTESKGMGVGRRLAAIFRGTVGNPLKDVAAPSVTVLVNVLAIVSLVIAPLLTR